CLQQVILNLVVNAMDAMDEAQAPDRRLLVRTQRLDDAVEGAVRDTGEGIPPDRLPRLFHAVFTTKPRGRGLGLGLPGPSVRGPRRTDLGRGPRWAGRDFPRDAALADAGVVARARRGPFARLRRGQAPRRSATRVASILESSSAVVCEIAGAGGSRRSPSRRS